MNKLKNLRGGMTQSCIAKEFDITQSHYGYIENGDRTPSLPLAKKMSDYFKKTIEEIFFN